MNFIAFLGMLTGIMVGSFNAWSRFGFNILNQKWHVQAAMTFHLGLLSLLALLQFITIPKEALEYGTANWPVAIVMFAIAFWASSVITGYGVLIIFDRNSLKPSK